MSEPHAGRRDGGRPAPRGGRYRVLVPLSYPTRQNVIERILAGEQLTASERAERRVEPGEIVSDLPQISIEGLLGNGWIEEVTSGDTG